MAQVTLTVGKTFITHDGESILDAALRQGVGLSYSCRTGRCSTCKARVIAGSTFADRDATGLSAAERNEGWILTCVRRPVGDLVLDAKEIDASRLVTPRTLPCKIHSMQRLTSDVMRVLLRFPHATPLRYTAGQYVDVIGKSGTRRSYSIANAQRPDGLVELHIRQVPDGVMSRYWFEEAKVNDLLRVNGPIGIFCLQGLQGLELVFLATGTGLAPVKAMLESLPADPHAGVPRSIQVYWGGRHREDLYWDLCSFGREVYCVPVLSRAGSDWAGARGHVQDVFLATAPQLQNTVVYACGSDAMIRSAKDQLQRAGLPPRQFFSDAFVCSSQTEEAIST